LSTLVEKATKKVLTLLLVI